MSDRACFWRDGQVLIEKANAETVPHQAVEIELEQKNLNPLCSQSS